MDAGGKKKIEVMSRNASEERTTTTFYIVMLNVYCEYYVYISSHERVMMTE